VILKQFSNNYSIIDNPLLTHSVTFLVREFASCCKQMLWYYSPGGSSCFLQLNSIRFFFKGNHSIFNVVFSKYFWLKTHLFFFTWRK